MNFLIYHSGETGRKEGTGPAVRTSVIPAGIRNGNRPNRSSR
jgi:hypothetical protein